MKIRQRLALLFTFVAALVTGAILIIIFLITKSVVHSDFQDMLIKQSRIEVVHYATPDVREVIDPSSYLLINPMVSIFDGDGNKLLSQGNVNIPSEWMVHLKQHELFHEEQEGVTTMGTKYNYQGKAYMVFVTARDVAAEHDLGVLVKAMVAGWGVSLLLSYLAGLYFSGRILKPVKHVVNDVKMITEDNLSYRLKLDKDVSQMDEIGELILTFNALLNRIESAFIAQKRFVQDASHELKTPLTAIMAEAELALTKDRNVEDYKSCLSVILTETERLVSTTQGLLTLARLEEGSYNTELEYVDVLEVCDRSINTVKLHHPERVIDFKKRPISFYVYGNRQLLEIAVLNILDNALKYSYDEIRVDVKKSEDEIFLTVSDKGVGIPKAELEKIKNPLFRGSNVISLPGAGLGLPLVDRIISVLKGKFEIMSEEGKGTTCILVLPVSEPVK